MLLSPEIGDFEVVVHHLMHARDKDFRFAKNRNSRTARGGLECKLQRWQNCRQPVRGRDDALFSSCRNFVVSAYYLLVPGPEKKPSWKQHRWPCWPCLGLRCSFQYAAEHVAASRAACSSMIMLPFWCRSSCSWMTTRSSITKSSCAWLVIRQDDYFIPTWCGQLHSWWLHSTPLQMERVVVQAHLPGTPSIHVCIHSALPHLPAHSHWPPKGVSV